MAYSNVNTAYATGTISAVSGTTVTLNETPSSNWVGRIIVLDQASTNLQWRKITAVNTSAKTITIQHSFDTSPIVGYTETNPASNTTYYISHTIDELVSSHSGDFKKVGDKVYDLGFILMSNGAFLFAEGLTIKFRTSRISILKNSGMVFGGYAYVAGADAIPKNSCTLIDYAGSSLLDGGNKADARAAGNRGERRTSTDSYTGVFGKLTNSGSYPGSLASPNESGLLEIWGGVWQFVTTNKSAFFYPMDADGKNKFRLVNLTMQGNLGVRFTGGHSAFVNVTIADRIRGAGFNPIVDIPRFEVSGLDASPVIYFWTQYAPPSLTRVGGLTGVSDMVTFSAKKAAIANINVSRGELTKLTNVVGSVSGSSGGSITLNMGSNLKVAFFNPDLSSVNAQIKTSLTDKSASSLNTQTLSGGGSFDEVYVIRETKAGVASNLKLSSFSSKGPFTLKAISYGKGILSQSLPLEKDEDLSLTLFDDGSITETDKSVVDAYTKIDTSEKLYDRAKAYLVDNYLGEAGTIITRTGDMIDAGARDVTIDKTAGAVFAVDANGHITLKADTFTGNITTTGVVALANGATLVGGIIDANGDSFLSFTGVDEWAVYASAANRASETSALGSGNSAQTYRFTYAASTTFYLALTVAGETIRKDIVPVGKGGTEVSLQTAAQLATLSAQIKAGGGAGGGGGLDEASLHSALDSYGGKGAWKADTGALAKETTTQAARDHARAANLQTQPQG